MLGVYVIWQLVTPWTVVRVQLADGANAPVELLTKLTVPVGGFEPEAEIVAVQVLGWSMAI